MINFYKHFSNVSLLYLVLLGQTRQSLTYHMNVFAHPELIAMVVPIFIEVTMSMVVMVVVAVASEAKIAITTESSSESTKTPGQGGSLVKACSEVRLVICLLVVFYMMVIFIVVHMALIMVVLGLGQTLVVSTSTSRRPAARRHHHQNRQNLFHFSIFGIVLDEMQQNTEDECSDLGQNPSTAIISI